MPDKHDNKKDADLHKGAVESDRPEQERNVSERGQLGHRNLDDIAAGLDTDFPEPGESPEHS